MSPLQSLLAPYPVTLTDNQHIEITAAEQSNDHQIKVTPLTHFGVISVLGQDAFKFLQGQLTCDLKDVSRLGSRLGAHCTIKGNIHALYRLISVEGGFLLRLDNSCLDAALSNIKKYIIFSKAEAENASEQYLGLGISGENCESLLATLFDELPAETDNSINAGKISLVKVPGNRYELWLPLDAAAEMLEKLTKTAQIGSTNDWIATEISAGIPDITAETQDKYLPQMTNLQALEGVSFRKGCYTGQEVVTRLQHRGKLSKFMMLATLDSTTLPEIGSAIGTERKDSVGQVLQAAHINDRQIILQAVVNKKDYDEQTLLLGSKTGPAVTRVELPYELEAKMFERKG